MWAKISVLAFIISAHEDNFVSASSEVDLSYPGNHVQFDSLEAPVYETGEGRDLQSCTPVHEGDSSSRAARYGSGLFYDEEIWTAPDVSGPMVLRWDLVNCRMTIGRHALPDQSYVYVNDGADTFIYDTLAPAYDHMHNDGSATYKAIFRLDSAGVIDIPARTISYGGVQQTSWPGFNMSPDEANFEALAMAAFDGFAFTSVWPRHEVYTRLLSGLGTMTKLPNTNSPTRNKISRLVHRNQIRIVNNGFYYITRKSVHGASSGLLQSANFFQLHNETDGGMNPSFSICENIDDSNEPSPSASAEIGLCCGTQCTSDMSKVYKSTLCEVNVNNCYNPLLDNCTVDTLPCEHVIAEPEDQVHALFPSTRSFLPEENIWTYLSRHDFVGGGRPSALLLDVASNYVIGTQTSLEANAEVRVSIPFSGSGNGNGRYEVTWFVALFQSYSTPTSVATLSVYSYSTGETLAQTTVTSFEPLSFWKEITTEVTIADRHLNDIAFKVSAIGNRALNFDYVSLKYLYHATLSPTPYPTPNPTPHPTPAPTPNPCIFANVLIYTDNYPQEVSWKWETTGGILKNSISQGFYANNLALYSHNVEACYGTCYRFTIYDSANDGLCCGYGSGYAKVILSGDTKIFFNSYSSSSSGSFCV